MRKQYLLDKKLQLGTTFTIIGVVTILAVVIILAIAYSVVYNNQRIENIYEIEDNIFQFLTSRTLGAEDLEFKNALKNIQKNHSSNMVTLQNIMDYNRILLYSIILFVIIEGFILYMLLIRRTHRVAGPIYVMSNYFKEIIDGNYPEPRSLRKKDELKDFYKLFSEMIEAMKERDRGS